MGAPATQPQRFRFSEARIRALPSAPAGTRLRYFDTATAGLCLRVTDAGAKTFKVYRKMQGKPVEVSLGTWPGLTVEAARKLAAGHLADLAAGINPNAAKRAIREETTLGELFADYLALHAKPRKRTWAEDERRFTGYLSGWKTRRLSAITPAEVQGWHARVGREHGPFAANRTHALLRKMFNFARTRGWSGGNPAVGVQRFTERSRERFMDGDELRRFFAALQAESERTPRDFFLLALLTGARRANVLGMRWEDVDLQRGLWRIPGEQAKSGEPLVVILATPVVELLRERKGICGASPWVLPSDTSTTGHYVEPKVAWARILARAELSRLAVLLAQGSGQDPDTAIQAAADQVEQVRHEALARKHPKGTDPLLLVLERYRAQATAAGINPDEARMRDLRIHDLRRTLGSWQAASGASLPIIGRSLGHKQVQTTAIYARLSLDPVRESVERATAAMLTSGGAEVKSAQIPGNGD